ncbi:MAG: beta-lactamase family protein [Candidatus Eremiobacteraeota bacterium]|nr:beta-lactamase family protein [Candidatus Eremiobacteraeota bacterium]
MIDATGPSDVGVPRALALVENAIGGVCSCAVLHVRQSGELVCEAAFGSVAPDGAAATEQSVFDLASLTKIAVGTALLTLLDRRRFALDDPIVATLPEFAGRDARRATVSFRHLLTHTSGLPPSVNARAEPGLTQVVNRVCATPLAAAPGERVVYSDCGFILVGEAVSRLAGVPLPIALQTSTFDPLAIGSCGYNPRGPILERTVCTERDAWRGRLLCGEVHDETCWSMGGVAGHAGLFGTADDVAKLGEMYRQAGQYLGRRVLERPTAQTAVREHAHGDDERRGLAWAIKPGDNRPWGSLLSRASYGHTGYTGTSLFVDPTRALTIVLLTNRVYVSRDPVPIADLRAAVNEAVIADLERSTRFDRSG